MKNLFLVLSDIHMKEGQSLDYMYTNGVGGVLNSLGAIDNICIIMAGDITFSGKTNEYKLVKTLKSRLISQIKTCLNYNKFIPYYVVPGNHDIDFNNQPRGRIDIKALHNEDKLDSKIDEELNKFENFYKFANMEHCFTRNKLIECKSFSTDGVSTQINILNSELFSSFRDELGDDDKGLHYFPEDSLSYLKKRNWSEYSITVMHRSPEWFTWQSARNLKNEVLRSSNIIIYGHEHEQDIQELKNKGVVLVKSGSFDYGQKDFSFSTITIDTDSHECEVKTYNWDKVNQIYMPDNDIIKTNLVKIENEGVVKLDEDFYRDFLYCDSYKLEDVFVFPDIDRYNVHDKQEKTIKNIDELYSIVNDNQLVYIEGDSKSGKTMLAKSLFLNLIRKKKTPIYIDIEDNNKSSYQNILKDAFCHQFGYEKEDYEKFKQMLKDDKFVILDNYDKISDKLEKGFLQYLKSEFNHVIILKKPHILNAVVETAKQNLLDENETSVRLKILPFYLIKRKELIKNVISNSVKKVEDIDKKVSEINSFITDQIQIFSLNPNFISMYASYYAEDTKSPDVHTNIFSIVFEHNIVKALLKYVDQNTILEYLPIYENLAYNMHFSKTYPITYEDIKSEIKKYNEIFMMEVNCTKFLKNSIDANIFEDLGNETYRFVDDSYLAYFIARGLNKKAHNNIDVSKELEWICTNICFNINGEILLFLSYLTQNVFILNFIFESAKKCMESWDEYDIKNNSIKFLENDFEKTFEMPSIEEKNKYEESLENQEKQYLKNLKLKTKSIYDDYDEEKVSSKNYKIHQAIRLLELVSKILPNFNYLMEKSAKIDLVKGIYSYPNKICNELFKDIDNEFDKHVEMLVDHCKRNKIDFDKNKIIRQLQYESEIFILNIFDMAARLSVNSKTIKVLDSIELKNINYKIQNVMMYENLGMFDEFANRADKIYDNTKDILVKTMIKRIIRKHFLCNKGIKQIGYVQKIADKYFGKQRKYLQ